MENPQATNEAAASEELLADETTEVTISGEEVSVTISDPTGLEIAALSIIALTALAIVAGKILRDVRHAQTTRLPDLGQHPPKARRRP